MRLIVCFLVVVVVQSLSPVKKGINEDTQPRKHEVDLKWSSDMSPVKLYPSETDPSLLIQPTPSPVSPRTVIGPSNCAPTTVTAPCIPSPEKDAPVPTVCTHPSSLCSSPTPVSSSQHVPSTPGPGNQSKPTQHPKPSKGKPGNQSDMNNKIRKEIKNIIDSLEEISKTLSG